jgi:hypothetical protein
MAKFKDFLASVNADLKKYKVIPVNKSAFKPAAPLDQFSSDSEIEHRIKEVKKQIAALERAHTDFHNLVSPTPEQAKKYRKTIEHWPALNFELERLEADLHGKVPDTIKKG